MKRRARRHPWEGWEPRYARSDLTVANVFTGARIALVPVFGYLWSSGDNLRALWVFGVAAATDVVDGFLARYLNQRSRLGALMDPIADKLLMLVALVVGVKIGAIPLWLALIIIGRDAVLATGAIILGVVWKGRHGPAAWRPTRIGKYAMLLQSSTVVLTIVDTTFSPAGMRVYVETAMLATAVLTIAAGAQYTVRAIWAVRRAAGKSRRGRASRPPATLNKETSP